MLAATGVVIHLTGSSTLAADRFFVGPANANWSTASWVPFAGGPLGASVPVDGDRATIAQSFDTVVNFDINLFGSGLALLDVSGVGGKTAQVIQSGNVVTINKFVLGNTNNSNGQYNLAGGVLTVNDGGFIGSASGSHGALNMTGGSFTHYGTLGVGTDGALAAGTTNGNGALNLSGGSFYADAIQLGNAGAGAGQMNVGGSAVANIGSGINATALTLNGGILNVLDHSVNGAYPANVDPNLHDSIVVGYQHDGSININSGILNVPNIKLGLGVGTIGSYVQSGGIVSVGVLGAGNNASLIGGNGIGTITVTGGTLTAQNVYIGSSTGGVGVMAVTGSANVRVNEKIIGNGGVVVSVGTLQARKGMVVEGLSMLNDARVTLGGSSRVKALFLGGTAAAPASTLDLSNGALVIDYVQGNLFTQATDAIAWIKSGRGTKILAGGTYNYDGRGITSSDLVALNNAAGFSKYAIGILNNADLPTPLTSFGGMTGIDSSSILMRVTYNGDANLDGRIDAADYALINLAYATFDYHNGWGSGDFNLDGVVNAADYAILDFAALTWGGVTFNGSVPVVVPEPTSVALLTLAGVAMTSRRQFRRSCPDARP